MTVTSRYALPALLILAFAALPVLAQDGAAADEELPTSAIKRIAISFGGGTYSGAEYFALPSLDENAQVADGSNVVTLFDGTEINLGTELPENGFGAPRKEIEAGRIFQARVGFYLNESFHIDLAGALALSEARLSLLQYVNGEDAGRISGTEEEGYLDTGFKAYHGGVQLGYDAHALRKLGLTPGFGMGFGGVINRFSTLEDKTALYFQLYTELSRELFGSVSVRGRYTATTFSMATEEVDYGKQVTTHNLTLGLTWMFDAKPIYAGR